MLLNNQSIEFSTKDLQTDHDLFVPDAAGVLSKAASQHTIWHIDAVQQCHPGVINAYLYARQHMNAMQQSRHDHQLKGSRAGLQMNAFGSIMAVHTS